MSEYNDTSQLPICDKHRHEAFTHALREEVIPLTVGMELEKKLNKANAKLAEYERQIKDGELVPISVGIDWATEMLQTTLKK